MLIFTKGANISGGHCITAVLVSSHRQVLESTSSPFLSEDMTTGADDDLDLNNLTVQCVVPMYIVQVGSDQAVLTGALSS